VSFDPEIARQIAENECKDNSEEALIHQFIDIFTFLSQFPEQLSWRTSKKNPLKPNINTEEGLKILASCYFSAYRRSDFPTEPSTVPDEMVSFIMEKAYGHSPEKCQEIKLAHQHSMGAENCVGNLLERYLNEQLKDQGWSWCCGDFVQAIDFIRREDDGSWILLQIKNRDNTENSSARAIRDGTTIQKWYRSFSKDTKKGRNSFTRWDKLPNSMQGYGLSEDGFKKFVASYLAAEKIKLSSMKAES
jgi:hypothetical protein